MPEERKAEYEKLQTGGHKALKLMESQLGKTQYLVGDKMTTADISLYAYTHVCDEGGFDLSSYPNIQAWLKRIEEHPNYSAMS
jgi:glutathione S-transferase